MFQTSPSERGRELIAAKFVDFVFNFTFTLQVAQGANAMFSHISAMRGRIRHTILCRNVGMKEIYFIMHVRLFIVE